MKNLPHVLAVVVGLGAVFLGTRTLAQTDKWQPDWPASTSMWNELCSSFNRSQKAHATCTLDHASWESTLTPKLRETLNMDNGLVPATMCASAIRDLAGVDSSETCLASGLAAAAPCRTEMAGIQKIVCKASSAKSSLKREGSTLVINAGTDYGSGPWTIKDAVKAYPSCQKACPTY